MRKFIAISAALALAACGGGEVEEAETGEEIAATDENSMLTGEEPGFEAVAPGTYQVTRSGGEVDFIEIHNGMTFSRVAADGTATGGSIFMKDGLTCFLVEGEEEEDCFEDGPRQPDGTMETTNANGDVSAVRPVEGSLEDHVDVDTASTSETGTQANGEN